MHIISLSLLDILSLLKALRNTISNTQNQNQTIIKLQQIISPSQFAHQVFDIIPKRKKEKIQLIFSKGTYSGK